MSQVLGNNFSVRVFATYSISPEFVMYRGNELKNLYHICENKKILWNS